ncbi:MAG: glutamine synthetase type III, partial [Acetivibrionales bacterium]
EDWVIEAEKRGLPNLRTAVDAIPALIEEKNIELFKRTGVLSPVELHSRYEIQLENYIKTVRIEALTMAEMISRQILPAAIYYVKRVADTVSALNSAGADSKSTKKTLDKLVVLTSSLRIDADALNESIDTLDKMSGDSLIKARAYMEMVIPIMEDLRNDADKLENLMDANLWPIPTYGDLLFGLI